MSSTELQRSTSIAMADRDDQGLLLSVLRCRRRQGREKTGSYEKNRQLPETENCGKKRGVLADAGPIWPQEQGSAIWHEFSPELAKAGMKNFFIAVLPWNEPVNWR